MNASGPDAVSSWPHELGEPRQRGGVRRALEAVLRGYQAVEVVYHAYLTGLILATAIRRGREDAAALVFKLFRRQRLGKFLPGLTKLGLHGPPEAAACAQCHYLSNDLGASASSTCTSRIKKPGSA